MRRFLSATSSILSLGYVAVLVGYVLLRHEPPQSPWWLDLANTFALYLFIPTLPLLLLGLVTSSRLTMLLCVMPVILFAWLYGGLFLPQPVSNKGSVSSITIVTHNVDAENPNPQRVIQLIEEKSADIVAIQELTADLAKALAARFQIAYPYQVLLPRADFSGVGVLSRLPVVAEESFALGHLAQHLVLAVDGKRVHLFNVHLYSPQIKRTGRRQFTRYLIRGFDTVEQTKEVTGLMQRVNQVDGPIVVVGDFNMGDQGRQYRQITRQLADALREVGWGFGHTFPANGSLLRLPLPLVRIDYIFHSRSLVAQEAYVGPRTGSDHLPVVARLNLADGE